MNIRYIIVLLVFLLSLPCVAFADDISVRLCGGDKPQLLQMIPEEVSYAAQRSRGKIPFSQLSAKNYSVKCTEEFPVCCTAKFDPKFINVNHAAWELTALENLLFKNSVFDDSFYVRIKGDSTDKKRTMRFGEFTDISIKLSEQGEYFILGYAVKDGLNQAYLLELNDMKGDRRFVGTVDRENAGVWLSIGEYSALPPFGTEIFHIVASDGSVANLIPKHRLDNETELYIIDDKSENIIKNIKIKANLSDKKSVVSEDVLLILTTE